MIPDLDSLINDFLKAVELAGMNLHRNTLSFEYLSAPHKPPSSLPKGKMAVYVCFWKGEYLKVGKVGPNSQARYISQHYNPSSSNSNLSESIIAAREKLIC
jgi:hypothetical protein